MFCRKFLALAPKIGAFIGQKLGPGPPKIPYSQVGWAPPSGKLVYSHTRNLKNAMVYGAQCSSTVLPRSRFFYRLFFASGPQIGHGAVPRSPETPGYCRGQVWERKIVKIFLAKQGDLKFGQSLVLQIDQTGVFKIWAESCA